MPRYDFYCLECKKEFELDLSLSEREDTKSLKRICPTCSSNKIEQLMTFKGGINTKGGFNPPPSAPCGGAGGCGGGVCPFN